MPLHETLSNYRVVPRIIAGFVIYSMWAFHQWFTQDGALAITDMSEWALIGYGTVQATFVGFFKFYMDSGCKKVNSSA